MKRYFSKEDFITFINFLKDNKATNLFTESLEDGSIDTHVFLKMQFAGNTIVLYNHPSGSAGIIQDTPVAPWEDYVEGVFDDLTMNDEYRIFVEP